MSGIFRPEWKGGPVNFDRAASNRRFRSSLTNDSLTYAVFLPVAGGRCSSWIGRHRHENQSSSVRFRG